MTTPAEVSAPRTTLVSAAELAAHPDWRVFDCSHDLMNPDAGPQAYAQAHIPGAIHAHVDTVLAGPKISTPDGNNGRHPLPDPAQFVAWLGAQGLRAHDQVVVYDRSGGMFAVRLWWMLRWVGHRAVAVLDGGLPQWLAAGYPVESGAQPAANYAPTQFDAQIDDSLWVSTEFVAQQTRLAGGSCVVVDARAPERYAGLVEPLDPVAGHIPGALNRPFQANLQADGRFKPAEQLRDDYLALLGDTPGQQVIAQCGSGVTGCHDMLAMEVAGITGVRLYVGSWSAWCSNPARPVATGAAP